MDVNTRGGDGASLAHNDFREEAKPGARASHGVEAEAFQAVSADKPLAAEVPRHVACVGRHTNFRTANGDERKNPAYG